LTLNLTLRGGWDIELEGNRGFIRPDPNDYLGITVSTPSGVQPFVPADRVAGADFGFEISTPTFRTFDASVEFGTGTGTIFEEAGKGRGLEGGFGLSLRPTTQIRLTAGAAYTEIRREVDDSEYARSLIPRLKAEYQATRHLFVRGIVEYRNERRAALIDPASGQPLLFNGVPIGAERDEGIRLDALISYEPTPGTVAYVGYGSSYAEIADFGRGFRRRDDGFFVKLAYQFRR
jgi:hypothetical protein